MDYFPTAEAMAEGLGLELLLRGDFDPRLLTRKERLSQYAADPLVSGNLYHRIREILVRERGRAGLGRVVLWITAPSGTLEQLPWAIGLAEQLTRQELRVFLLGQDLPRMLPGAVGVRGEALPASLRSRVALLHREPTLAVRTDLEGVRLVLPAEGGVPPQGAEPSDAWAALLVDALPEDVSGPLPSKELIDGVVFVASFKDHSIRELTHSLDPLVRAGFPLLGTVVVGPAGRAAADAGAASTRPTSMWRSEPARDAGRTEPRGIHVLPLPPREQDLRTGKAIYGGPPRGPAAGAATEPPGRIDPVRAQTERTRGPVEALPAPGQGPSQGSAFAGGGGGSILDSLRRDGLERRPSRRDKTLEPVSTFPDLLGGSDAARGAESRTAPPASFAARTSPPSGAGSNEDAIRVPGVGMRDEMAGASPVPRTSNRLGPSGPANPGTPTISGSPIDAVDPTPRASSTTPAIAAGPISAETPVRPEGTRSGDSPRDAKKTSPIPPPEANDAARERSVALFAHWNRETHRQKRRQRIIGSIVAVVALGLISLWVYRSWPQLVKQYPFLAAIAPAPIEATPSGTGAKKAKAKDDTAPKTTPPGANSTTSLSTDPATVQNGESGTNPDPGLVGTPPRRETGGADSSRKVSERGALPEMRPGPGAPTLMFPDRLRVRSSGADSSAAPEEGRWDEDGGAIESWNQLRESDASAVSIAEAEAAFDTTGAAETNRQAGAQVPAERTFLGVLEAAAPGMAKTVNPAEGNTAVPGVNAEPPEWAVPDSAEHPLDSGETGAGPAAEVSAPLREGGAGRGADGVNGGEIAADTRTSADSSVQASDPDVFAVHLSSFRHREEADADVRRLADLGIEARAVLVDVPKLGPWYRVVTGRFATFPQARDEAQRLTARIGLERTHVVGKDGRGQPVPIPDFESDSDSVAVGPGGSR